MTTSNYSKLTTGLIAAWFAFSLIASALHLYTTDSSQPPLPILLAVLTPLAIFALWYASSPAFREFVLSLNPRTLTLVHAWRVGGFVFLVLYAYHILPGIFALPAGWGDITIGATAGLVASKLATPNHRTSFIVWQILGITDLVTAVTLGAASQFLLGSDAITAAPMSVLPLSLIPTFAVPLLLMLHIICIAQARRWPKLSPIQGTGASSLAV